MRERLQVEETETQATIKTTSELLDKSLNKSAAVGGGGEGLTYIDLDGRPMALAVLTPAPCQPIRRGEIRFEIILLTDPGRA